ncbi:MAG: hypothetical protein JWR19_3339 [Pedosphaera sp.]|nr:hypothetical protein [Pedosphaera sp.]
MYSLKDQRFLLGGFAVPNRLSCSKLMTTTKLLPRLLCILLFSCCVQGALAQTPFKLLVFSKTAGARHTSITNGIAAIQQLAVSNNFTVDATEDGAAFTDANLAQYKAIVFLLTSGDVLDTNQQAVFQRFIEAGGGFVGVHSAADTGRSWPWYGQLLGAYELNEPAGPASATIKVTDRFHPSTKALPERWVRSDDYYNFQTNPEGKVHVLAWVDETTASNYFASAPGAMGFDHPIAWCQNFDGGRSWYTALGHTDISYAEPLFQQHLLGGILWAAGVIPGDAGATVWSNFQRTVLDNNNLVEPIAMDIAADGRVFYIERVGRLNVFKLDTSTRVQTSMSVNANTSCGLIGVALDPGFASNNWVYLVYTPAGTETNRLSRFTITNNMLDFTSEKILLTVPVESSIANHMAGDLEFSPSGDLYMSVGDNSRFSGSPNNGYAPLDERLGQSQGDSQRTAANSMSLRGKILRIHPLPDGTYSIPAGNLFAPGTLNTRPEIYVMGNRNPFRIAVDTLTGWLYWGEVGPDANADSAAQGPRGYDEFNQARQAGFFGWPYGIANNKPYQNYDFATGVSSGFFDLTNVVNTSPNNTGITNLPPAQPAWIWYPYGATSEFPELGSDGSRCAFVGCVYRFKTNVLSAAKLPAYYDNTVLVMDFARNWLREVKMDSTGAVLKINKFLPNYSLASPIDMKTGPDGSLYLIEYGNGWRSANVGGQLTHITYTAGNHPPVAVAAGTPTDGAIPLHVVFSSAGSVDPEGGPISYAWDFKLGGLVDSTNANTSFTYTSAGNYIARLTVTDNLGAQGISDVFISAGNTRPVVTVPTPPNGSFYNWLDFIRYSVKVTDVEDGSTDLGTIDCNSLVLETALGHEQHAHSADSFTGCQGAFQVASDHAGTENIYWLFSASYTDHGAPGVAPLEGGLTYRLNPKRLEAEHYLAANGVTTQNTTDNNGVLEVASIDPGDSIMFTPINLTNITNIVFRTAAPGAGGSIEVRLDATNGTSIGTAIIPGTASVYTNVNFPVTDPGGTHSFYFVFRGGVGATNLFTLNWIEFQGPGVGIPLQPYSGTPVSIPGTIQAEDFDIGGAEISYHDTTPGNSGGQYRLDTDVDIESCNDSGGGFDLTNVRSNEWVRYTINPVASGSYTFQARVASAGVGGTFRIEQDGEDLSGPISIPDTGGAHTWQSITISNIILLSGTQTIRLNMLSEGASGSVGNFNYLSATLTSSNIPPSVTLAVPSPGATFSGPANIQLAASAADADGSITKVEFYAGTNLVGQGTTSPYSLIWSNVAPGSYSLTAKAYDNLNATQTSLPATVTVLGPGWGDQDIGTIGTGPGGYSYNTNTGVYQITDSGADIWNAADAFHFVYQRITNNAEIIARVVSVQNTDPWAKAGVMFRETLAAGSRNTFMGISSANGALFSWRDTVSPSSASSKQAGILSPYWVRVVRIGNDYTGYLSANGTNWTKLGSTNIPMASPLYVGIGVTSHNAGAMNTSSVDNVVINRSPEVLASPTNRVVNAGKATDFGITLNGGQPMSYQWRLNGTDILGATNPVYSITAVQSTNAGDYIAVVTNSLGSVTSSIAHLTVNLGPLVAISSPSSGSVFARPTNLLITATASDGDGVARVDFYSGATWLGFKTNSPYVFTWTNSPNGSFLLTALATDNLGATNLSGASLVTFTNPPPQITFPAGNPWSNGSLQLNFIGVPGDTIYIQSSGDLVNWNTISTNVLSGGSYIFTDTASSNYSRQFYRARYQ